MKKKIGEEEENKLTSRRKYMVDWKQKGELGLNFQMDHDLVRIWQLIHELGEQLNYNQKLVQSITSQAGSLKDNASHTGAGLSLRRFNVDISKEIFESELERTNAHTIIDNQTLLYENKQLSVLLKEYESTMETIMSKFRHHAVAAQQHELNIMRHYEALLIARETCGMSSDLLLPASATDSVQHLARHLQCLMRSLAGEDPQEDNSEVLPVDLDRLLSMLDTVGLEEDREDWSQEREAEINRLEHENEDLRRMLGIDTESLQASGIVIDSDRIDRTRPLLASGLRRQSPSQNAAPAQQQDIEPGWRLRALSAEGPNVDGGQSQSLSGAQSGYQSGGAPLQRAMELQSGSRVALPRRVGMFGSAGRGTGRGAPPQPSANYWSSNQPPLPAPPMLISERSWMTPGGGS